MSPIARLLAPFYDSRFPEPSLPQRVALVIAVLALVAALRLVLG